MSFILYLFTALIALSVMIFIHELGHFIVARINGVKVERFSIGFGKILARRECCSTEWAISMIPLGGYVKMKGQDDSDPLLRDYDSDSYGAKKPWQRITILLAGPLANIVLAFFIYLYLALSGAPLIAAKDYIAPVVGKLSPDSPAQKAGLKKGDLILAIGEHKIKYWYEIGEYIQQEADPVDITIEREGKIMRFSLSTKTIDDRNEFQQSIKRRIIGIAPEIEKNIIIRFGLRDALFYAYNETKKASFLIVRGIKKMLTGEVASSNVGGPITIFDLMMKFAQAGFSYLLFITALLSVNLGVLNLLPIPALDGGHILLNLYEIVSGKEPSELAYYRLTLLGWAILAALMFLGFYNDINRLIGGVDG